MPDAAQQKLAQWSHDFHHAPDWKAATGVLKDFYVRFKDELEADASFSRFAKFAGRVIFEHAPEELTAEQQSAMKRHIASRLLNPDLNAPYMTIPAPARSWSRSNRNAPQAASGRT